MHTKSWDSFLCQIERVVGVWITTNPVVCPTIYGKSEVNGRVGTSVTLRRASKSSNQWQKQNLQTLSSKEHSH